MKNILPLYKVELRKIFIKKAVWIALAIGLLLILAIGFTNLLADGHIAYVKEEEKTLSLLSGEKMDEAFFTDFHEEILEEIEKHPDLYASIQAFDPGAVYQNAASAIGKTALYDLIYNVMRDREAVANVTEESFYAAMRYDIEHDGRELGSTDDELAFWLASYDSIEKPMTYSYALAYLNILDVLFLVGWVLALNISVALAGVFADEKTYRTDALVLSARNGRIPLCTAKILAGVTAALLEALLLISGLFGVMFAFYGTTGYDAMIQNIIPSSPWNITIGKMLLLYGALAVVTSLFFALSNMILSHFTHSATGTLALHAALLFLGLFNVPSKLGTLAKLWLLRPTMALYYGSFCNTCRYGALDNVTFSLIVYTASALIMGLILTFSYRRTQVESH